MFPGRSGAIAANVVPATIFQRGEATGVPDLAAIGTDRSPMPVFELKPGSWTMVARKKTSSVSRKAPGRKTSARKTSTRRAKKASPRRWSQRVTQESDALDLKARRVQADQREEDRSIAEVLGGAQLAPEIRRLSLGALDADLLHQSRRQEPAEDGARPAGTGEGRIETPVRQRIAVAPGDGRDRKRQSKQQKERHQRSTNAFSITK